MMSNDTTVSIVIPSYNMGWSIGRAIRSCQNQTYSVHEIIVVNDASTDETERILDEEASKDSRIRHVVLPFHVGCAAAMITGISNAAGEWIAFLDADDELTPASISDRLSVVERHTGVKPGLIYGHLYAERASPDCLTRFPELNGYCYPYLCKQLSLCAQIVLMVRSDCFSTAGFPSPEFPSSTDDDMVLTIARHFTIACIGKPVAIAHAHDSPTRMTNNPLRVARGVAMLVRKYQRDIALYHGKRYVALWWLRIARAYLFAEIHRFAENERGAYLHLGPSDFSLRFLTEVYRRIVRITYRGLDFFLRRHFDYIYF